MNTTLKKPVKQLFWAQIYDSKRVLAEGGKTNMKIDDNRGGGSFQNAQNLYDLEYVQPSISKETCRCSSVDDNPFPLGRDDFGLSAL